MIPIPYFVSPVSKELALEHLKILTHDERRSRFCMVKNDSALELYAKDAKGRFYGVFVIGQIIPVSLLHYVPIDGVAEVAFSTNTYYQGKGYAKVLMYFVKGLAEIDNVDTLIMSGLSSNKAMQHLAVSVGFEVETDYGEFDARVKTWRSRCKELNKNLVQMLANPLQK